MGCNCGGGRVAPRYSNTPGGNHHPDGGGMWAVLHPGATKPDWYTHEWQAIAARSTGGGRLFPPGMYPPGEGSTA